MSTMEHGLKGGQTALLTRLVTKANRHDRAPDSPRAEGSGHAERGEVLKELAKTLGLAKEAQTPQADLGKELNTMAALNSLPFPSLAKQRRC